MIYFVIFYSLQLAYARLYERLRHGVQTVNKRLKGSKFGAQTGAR